MRERQNKVLQDKKSQITQISRDKQSQISTI